MYSGSDSIHRIPQKKREKSNFRMECTWWLSSLWMIIYYYETALMHSNKLLFIFLELSLLR
jgi:hypothetical protein